MLRIAQNGSCLQIFLSVLAFKDLSPYILDKIALYSFVISLIAFAGFLWFLITGIVTEKKNKHKNKKPNPVVLRTIIITCLMCFVILLFGSVLLGHLISNTARAEVTKFLGDMDSNSVTVKIRGGEISSEEEFLNSIKRMRKVAAHHSHVNEKVECEIAWQSQKLRLLIGQDSSRKDEYWVFYPKYRYTRLNEIARFYSDTLDLKRSYK